MSIPLQESCWAELGADAKRDRMLDAARNLFAREGLGASMPAIAAAAGAGVGSLYRQFADKDDLIAALVLQRLREVREQIEAAPAGVDAWADFTAMLWRVIDTGSGCDEVMTEAIAATSARSDVSGVRTGVHQAIEGVMERARLQGSLRADAGVPDIKLFFAGVRAAERQVPGGGRRIAELLIAGMRAVAEGLPANLAGIRADAEGLPANLAGMRAGAEGLPANLAGMRADAEGLPANLAGMRAGAEGPPVDVERYGRRS